MQQELLKSILGTFIRTVLTSTGAWLVARQYITQTDYDALTVGIVALLATLAWSVYQKIQANRYVKAALSLPSNATLEDIKAEAKTPNPGSFVKVLIPFALVLSAVTSQVGCFKVKDPVAKPAVYSAQSAAALAGVQDVLIILNDAGIVKDRRVFAQHDKITTGMEVFYARIQANGYDRKSAITAIQQVLNDVEVFQRDVSVISDPNAKAKLSQIFFTLQFTLNSVKAVVEATQEPDPNEVIIARTRFLETAQAPWWNSVVLVAQETAIRMIAQSRMTREQAWGDTAAIVATIHQKNAAKMLSA